MLWLPLFLLVSELGGLQNPGQRTTRGTIAAVVAGITLAPVVFSGLRIALHDFLINPVRAWLIRRATGQPVYFDYRHREFHERRRRTRPGTTAPEEQDRID